MYFNFTEHYEPIRDVDVGDMGNKLPFINKTVKTEQQRQAVRQFFREAVCYYDRIKAFL